MNDVLAFKREETIKYFMKEAGVPNKFLLSQLPSNLSKAIGRSLYITGGVGKGKTYLMASLIRNRLERIIPPEEFDTSLIRTSILKRTSNRIKFKNTTELLEEIKSSYSSQSPLKEQEIMNEYTRDLDWLFLDDIGTEKTTEWVNQKFYQIINTIYSSQGINIVVSSNLSLSQLSAKIDERISSRLLEICTVIEVEGKDRRANAVDRRTLCQRH